MASEPKRGDPSVNPNTLHEYHKARRGPKDVPFQVIVAETNSPRLAKDPGHPHAQTKHISFHYYDQRTSNAPFGYEHYISVPPAYDELDTGQTWPLILFLHGAGESQRGPNESYASLRHGVPKVILCYDRWKEGKGPPPSIDIPPAPRRRKNVKQTKQGDQSTEPVAADVCTFAAENFITVTPSLNLQRGYGWNPSILSALLDEIIQRYPVDVDRIHLTGFSMGGYGTWDFAMHTPRRFASLMPICGGGDALRVGPIKHIPQWVHHGDRDDIIPLAASQEMVTALQRAGADVKFTRYPDLMHDSWTTAYGDLEVYRWMLQCRRRGIGDEVAVPHTNKAVIVES